MHFHIIFSIFPLLLTIISIPKTLQTVSFLGKKDVPKKGNENEVDLTITPKECDVQMHDGHGKPLLPMRKVWSVERLDFAEDSFFLRLLGKKKKQLYLVQLEKQTDVRKKYVLVHDGPAALDCWHAEHVRSPVLYVHETVCKMGQNAKPSAAGFTCELPALARSEARTLNLGITKNAADNQCKLYDKADKGNKYAKLISAFILPDVKDKLFIKEERGVDCLDGLDKGCDDHYLHRVELPLAQGHYTPADCNFVTLGEVQASHIKNAMKGKKRKRL